MYTLQKLWSKLWRRKADQKKLAFHKPSLGVSWPRILGVFHKVKSIYSYLQNARPRTRSMERCQHPRFCLHKVQLAKIYRDLALESFYNTPSSCFTTGGHWRSTLIVLKSTPGYSGLKGLGKEWNITFVLDSWTWKYQITPSSATCYFINLPPLPGTRLSETQKDKSSIRQKILRIRTPVQLVRSP